MASILNGAVEIYNNFLDNADPRVENMFLMGSPFPCIIISLSYVYLVTIAGPKWMKNRPAFELRALMFAYNMSMVALSTYIMFEFGFSGWFTNYSLSCQPVDYTRSPQAMRMINVCWWFYISKYIELLDTVFFVIRKKNSQVSFLHVLHHGIMPISWYFGVKLVPGGFGTFHGLLNSFIHLVMYTYYGLSALGPAVKPYLWWKVHMTKLQMIQFVCVCIHSAQLLFIDCPYPMAFVYIIGTYAAVFLVLFTNFYIQAYMKKRPTAVTSTEKHLNGNANSVAQNGNGAIMNGNGKKHQ